MQLELVDALVLSDPGLVPVCEVVALVLVDEVENQNVRREIGVVGKETRLFSACMPDGPCRSHRFYRRSIMPHVRGKDQTTTAGGKIVKSGKGLLSR